ncbi:MAG: type 4a pilus biogenesis protein PilO [Myxococcota bacterium]
MDLGTDQFQAKLEKFQKLPRAYRLAALPVLAALVLGAYFYIFYIPVHESLQVARSKQFELQRKLNEVRSVAANMGSFEEEVSALEIRLKLALRQLPDSKELPVLLTDITSLGKNAGLEFKAFRPRPEVMRDFYAEVPIEIEFQGGFHEIADFFDRVAKLPRVVNVSELEMLIGDESAQTTMLTVKGKATTFRFIEEPPNEAEPKAVGQPGGHGRARGGAA